MSIPPKTTNITTYTSPLFYVPVPDSIETHSSCTFNRLKSCILNSNILFRTKLFGIPPRFSVLAFNIGLLFLWQWGCRKESLENNWPVQRKQCLQHWQTKKMIKRSLVSFLGLSAPFPSYTVTPITLEKKIQTKIQQQKINTKMSSLTKRENGSGI